MYKCKIYSTSSDRKKVINDQNFQIYVSDRLNPVQVRLFLRFKEVPLRIFFTRNICSIKLFPLSSCQYVSTIPEKNVHVTDLLKIDIFVRICTEKMMGHQYSENSARDMYSNYNQMRAYLECSPNQ